MNLPTLDNLALMIPLRKQSGVYLIKNTVLQKSYVGSSKNIGDRLRSHARIRISAPTQLGADIRKYGLRKFAFSVLELCDQASLRKHEAKHIMLHRKSGKVYNLNDETGALIIALFHSTKTRLNARDVSDLLRITSCNASQRLVSLFQKKILHREHVDRRGIVYSRP